MTERAQPGGLRRKLSGLLSAFAVFAVISAAAVIYGIQWHVEGAVEEFQRALGQTVQVDRLRLALKEQILLLREVIEGKSTAVQPYFASRDALLTGLRQVAAFDPDAADSPDWSPILKVANELAKESDRCLQLTQEKKTADAQELWSSRIDSRLAEQLDSQLVEVRALLDVTRNEETRHVGATSAQVMFLTAIVGICAAGMAILGVTLIRRWLILPIADLQDATQRLGRGDLSVRVSPRYDDELGALGDALNQMAQSLTTAHSDLMASETKHRLLFQNVRDAVVICDSEGCIVEYHDNDTRFLGVDWPEHVGRHFLQVWPNWRSIHSDLTSIVQAAVQGGRRHKAVDIELSSRQPGVDCVYVDVLVCRIEYGDTKYAAIVMRDVTDRQQLQRKLRQAETMEAVGTLAGGLAHDFNNILAGVIGSLSMLATEITDSRHAERLRGVIQNCWQAAGLSRRLLNFAGSAHGEPQVFCLREALGVITESLDPSFVEGIELRTFLDHAVSVRMDRDQLTQIVLNLLRNARDAMPDGGTLRVAVKQTIAVDPNEGHQEQPYAVLVVQDTGCGMTREIQRRVFDPFFTTKSRSSRRGRGMGLAIAHTAIRNAGGFVQIESESGRGTTFQVYLPVSDRTLAAEDGATIDAPTRVEQGTILVVEEDSVIRDVAVSALREWGYSVLCADGAVETKAKLAQPQAASVSLAIIDRTLSDGDSFSLTQEVLALVPHARIIFTTASEAEPLPRHLAPKVSEQLLKPFELSALAAAVSAVMAPSSTPR